MYFALQGGEHEVVALAGKHIVWSLPCITDRAANDDALWQQLEFIGRMCPQPLQKNMAEFFEAQSLFEDGCVFERPAGGDGFEGLQKAAALREIQKNVASR